MSPPWWWLASAIQATRTLSGWSTRWSRASASTSVALAAQVRGGDGDELAVARGRRERGGPGQELVGVGGGGERGGDEEQRIVAGARRLDDRGDRRVVTDHEPAEQLVHAATIAERR